MTIKEVICKLLDRPPDDAGVEDVQRSICSHTTKSRIDPAD